MGDESAVAGLVPRNAPAPHEFIDAGGWLDLRRARRSTDRQRPLRDTCGPSRAATLLAQSDGRLVFRRSCRHEYGESVGGAIFAAEQHLVGGVVGAGWLPHRYVSVRVAAILVSLARGSAKDLSAADDYRRSVSSRCQRDVLLCRRAGAL